MKSITCTSSLELGKIQKHVYCHTYFKPAGVVHILDVCMQEYREFLLEEYVFHSGQLSTKLGMHLASGMSRIVLTGMTISQ